MSDRTSQIRYTTALILGMAKDRIFPCGESCYGGYTLEDTNNFFYTFYQSSKHLLEDSDLADIQNSMARVTPQRLPIVKEVVTLAEAESRIKVMASSQRLEQLKSISEVSKIITLVHLGDKWWDLCQFETLANVRDVNPGFFELTDLKTHKDPQNPGHFYQTIYGTSNQV